MAGGTTPDSTPNDTFWQYNSILDEWKELSNLQNPRSELGLAIVDGCVYAVGGSNGERRLATVERYDPTLNNWKYCSPMKIAISSPAVCSLSGLLFVIGGSFFDNDDVIDLVQVYNPASDCWKELAPMITPRCGAGACALNDKVYVMGGYCTSELNVMEVYDSIFDKWDTCPPMLEKRQKPGVALLNNLIYVCGGRKSPGNYHDSIEAFSVDTQQWSIISWMSSGRSFLSCATLKLPNPMVDCVNEIIKDNTSF
jgi:N-acetylneuraminic acid mutarotase